MSNGLELSDTSIFSLPEVVFGNTDEVKIENFKSQTVQQFIRKCKYNEETIPAGLDSENALLEAQEVNPSGDYIDPRKLEYELAKPYVEAFKRLAKNKDFKLFKQICIDGYMSAIWKRRESSKDANLEMMKSKEIIDKCRVAFAILNQFNDIRQMESPAPTPADLAGK